MIRAFAFGVFWGLLKTIAVSGQDPVDLIARIKSQQAKLRVVSYSISRTDSLVTGDVRKMKGRVRVQVDPADSLFGFIFHAERADIPQQVLYNGRVGYEIDDRGRTYRMITDRKKLSNLPYSPAGQLLMPDLIKLDTAKAIRLSCSNDGRHIWLSMHYPDLPDYDVTNRYTTMAIDSASLLPVSVRRHQQTLGKTQDLYYEIQSVTFSEVPVSAAFFEPAFLRVYKQAEEPDQRAKPVLNLKGKQAPALRLPSLDEEKIAEIAFEGKVTLLDFWEVWCGPCIESMASIDALAEKYAGSGLQVYGITHETRQLDAARKLVKKKGISFRTLIGNQSTKGSYQLTAIPLYVLIDQRGKICFMEEGYSPRLEAEIVRLLK
nr:TlpA disulfide reductase family protein [uncultured Dyadobacter sp.]